MSFVLRLTPAAAACVLLVACGGGSPTSPPLPSGGIAVDGPLSGMTVVCDGNGVSVITNGAGNFTFAAPGCASSMTGRGGVDIDTTLPFRGQLKAPAGSTVLSPLTSLLSEGMSQAQVLGMLGLPASIDLQNTDPSLKSGGVLVNPDLMKRMLVVEQLLQTAAEAVASLGGVTGNAELQLIYGEVAASAAVLLKGGGTLVSGSTVDLSLVTSLMKAATQRVAQAAGVAASVKTALAAINADTLAQVVAGPAKVQAEALLKSSSADLVSVAKLVQSDQSIANFVKANVTALGSPPSAATATLATTLTAQATANLSAGSGAPVTALALPVTFEETTAPVLTGFGGAEDSSIVTDPVAGTGKVAKVVKVAGSEVWAGTTVSTGANLSIATVPFATGATSMNLRVWSPDKGIPVRLKLENAADNTKTVETEAVTTVAGGWQTLTFNFANPAAGTAALNLATVYNKASVFFNFGTAGSGKTYYFDDLTFGPGPATGGGGTVTPSALPVTFEETTAPVLTGFGGAEDSSVVTDPVAGTGKVAKVVKVAGSEVWAGTTVSTGANLSIATVPFATGATSMNLRVWSPDKGIPVRLKLENAADNTKTVETEAVTTVAGGWQTLTFNFANPAAGTAALNLATVYNKASVFFNFGTAGSGKTYYFDDLAFGAGPTAGGGTGTVSALPVTFEETTTPVLTGFGGAEDSSVVTDPVAGTGKVAKVVKATGSEVWAGTTVSTGANLSIATVPFANGATSMNLRVWSPDKGIPVRLKLENATDNSKTVETEAVTTVAGGWQTLTFNFANQAAGTAALNLATVYNKASVFFNFGTAGTGKTYYFDDLAFGPGPVVTAPAPSDYMMLAADSISLVNGGSVTAYTMAQFQSDAGIRVSWPLPAPMTLRVTLAEVGSYVIPAGMKLSAAVSISETAAGGKAETQAYIEGVNVTKTAGGLEITVPASATATVFGVSSDGKKKAVIDFTRDVAGITNTLKTAVGSNNSILFGSVVNYAINKLSNDFTGIYSLRGKYRVSIVLNELPLRKADGSLLPAVTVVVPTQINSSGAVVASKTVTGAGLVGYITLAD